MGFIMYIFVFFRYLLFQREMFSSPFPGYLLCLLVSLIPTILWLIFVFGHQLGLEFCSLFVWAYFVCQICQYQSGFYSPRLVHISLVFYYLCHVAVLAGCHFHLCHVF